MTANRHDARGTQGVVQGDPYKEGAAPRRRPPTASQDLVGHSADDFALGDGGLFGGRDFQGEGFEDVNVTGSGNGADDVGVTQVGNSGLDSFRIAVLLSQDSLFLLLAVSCKLRLSLHRFATGRAFVGALPTVLASAPSR